MKLRWSNGSSRAVEFEVDRVEDCAAALENAMLDYRRGGSMPLSRIELHVEGAPNLWALPIFPLTEAQSVPAYPRVSLPAITAGTAHVINCVGRAADPTTELRVRGTDYVLIVGPDNWHGDAVFRACCAGREYISRLRGFVADVAEAVRDGEGKQHDQ